MVCVCVCVCVCVSVALALYTHREFWVMFLSVRAHRASVACRCTSARVEKPAGSAVSFRSENTESI
jgi:hypothetical protein